MCSLRVVVLKTSGTRQSIVHCLPNWAVLCGQRGCCFHETLQFWSAPIEISGQVFRFYLALSRMMHAYLCNHMLTHLLHLRLFVGQLMAVLTSATRWPTAAHVSVLRQSSHVLKLCCYTVLASTTLSRGFFIINKLFITFGGRTVISALILSDKSWLMHTFWLRI